MAITPTESEIERKLWFNFKYEVLLESESRDNYVPSGDIIPHPISMKMTLDQFLKAEKKMRKSDSIVGSYGFLELEVHKLESPQYDPESVRRINNFATVFVGRETKMIPDATTDMSFGEMYLRIYTCKDQLGIVTVHSSTGNEFANTISLYGFTENRFKETVNKLGLPIQERR